MGELTAYAGILLSGCLMGLICLFSVQYYCGKVHFHPGWILAGSMAYSGYSYAQLGAGEEFFFSLWFGSILFVGATIDMQRLILPDEGAILLLTGGILRAVVMEIPVMELLLQAVLSSVFFWLIRIISRGGMGLGDVKWMFALAFWQSMNGILVCIWMAFLLGALFGIVWSRAGRKLQYLPFGPFLGIGSMLGYFYGNELVRLYLQLTGW